MLFPSRRRAAKLMLCAALFVPAWGTVANPQTSPTQPPASPDPAHPRVKEPPPTPIAVMKDELGEPSWDASWNRIIEDALPPELLFSRRAARDVRPFCPRFRKMTTVDKRAFWAYFFQALSGAEAGLSPTSDVRHTEVDVRDTVTRRMVRCEGLLQLTYMDADRYGCNFDWEKDKDLPEKDPAKTILQPKNNLTCGIRILDDQLMTRHERLLSPSSYWATLRPGTPGFRDFIRQMTDVPANCRRQPRLVKVKKKSVPAAVVKDAARGTATSVP